MTAFRRIALAALRRDPNVERFSAEAPAFARSPLHRDPARLARLLEVVRPRPGERGLDVACGPGIVAEALAAAGVVVTAVDLTPAMLRQFAAPGLLRVCAAADRLPFGDGRFDLAVCRNSFHHFPEPGPIAAGIARVLRPGGRLVIEDMVADEDLRARDAQEVIERLRDRAHARSLPLSEMRALVHEAGLVIEAEAPRPLVIDFEEWINRPAPSPEARARARRLIEARLGAADGVRAFLEEGRLFFERPGVILRAVRP